MHLTKCEIHYHMIEQVDDLALGESDMISDKIKNSPYEKISNTQSSPATHNTRTSTYSYH